MSSEAHKQDQKTLRLIEAFDDIFDDVEVRHAAQVVETVPDGASVARVLNSARTICLPIQQEINTSLCLECDHFIGSQRMADGSLLLRCWTHEARPRLARGTAILKVADPKMH